MVGKKFLREWKTKSLMPFVIFEPNEQVTIHEDEAWCNTVVQVFKRKALQGVCCTVFIDAKARSGQRQIFDRLKECSFNDFKLAICADRSPRTFMMSGFTHSKAIEQCAAH